MAFFRMRLINVEAFLGREELIKSEKELDRRTSIFAFHDDDTTDYAILSHRWIEQEVNYDEMNDLAKMDKGDIDEITCRDGYGKILDSCKQAKRDKYEWLWIDTCCIDKRSSAELSEAINSMYRWYENSGICYAYLHDVADERFPTASGPNGWPEWFSRGWTLQEMIAPSDVRFFNKNWQPISDKTKLAPTLAEITGVPEHILTDGLRSNRPCVAQIMSWAANRETTRVEDKAYSLLGLLDVNMPMLYGEGKKAFHRLQLEIIRVSEDQSIFAWDYQKEEGRTCSILADHPSCFRECSEMELIDPGDFIKEIQGDTEKQLSASGVHDTDQLSVFLVTNRGIQIWLPLRYFDDSDSVVEAQLPCRSKAQGSPVTIKLALWERKYNRHFTSSKSSKCLPCFKSVYLRYQDLVHDTAFEIDDHAVTENGFTYCGTYPSKLAGNLILTDTNRLYVEVYSYQATLHLAVGYGKIPGQHWIHLVCQKLSTSQCSWEDYAKQEYEKMLDKRLEYAAHMADVCSRGERYRRVLVKHISFPDQSKLTHTLRTSCVMWQNSKICAVRFDVFDGVYAVEDKWTGFDIDVGEF